MLATLIAREASTSAPKVVLPIQSIGHRVIPPRQTLYQVLSQLPNDGLGFGVVQTRWHNKGIEGSYWRISRVKLKLDGTRGKAWGRLIWKGKVVSERAEEIRGGLKYYWATIGPQPIPLPKSLPEGASVTSVPLPPEALPPSATADA